MAAMSKTWVDKYFDVNDLRTVESWNTIDCLKFHAPEVIDSSTLANLILQADAIFL